MAKKPAPDDEDDKGPEGEGADGEVKPLDDEGGKGLNAKKLIMIIVPILLLGVGAALYFSGVFGGSKAEGEAVTAEAGAAPAGEGGHGEGGEGAVAGAQFLEIPDLLVNLASAGGQQRFLKLKVKLEVASPEDLAKLEAVAPRVVDQFQTFLREMRVQDLRGSAGIYRLRQELLYRVNLAAQPVKVKDVLFQEMLVQ
ncbi:MAG: flagellar basal body-associated FliL family protein [Alphaproteobacteria bacterium]|nr:flagellar basal body-associated FliL family protein [Alphaproteobacteria bacterium]